MEETQSTSENQSSYQSGQSSPGVSFPTVGEPKKTGGIKTLLVVGVLILVAILGFMIYKSASKDSANATPTPDADILATPSTDNLPVVTAQPTSTPAAKVNKSEVEIQIQNGTGITGEAAYLQTQLSALGYSNIKVANSDATVTATSVTFLNTLDSSVVTEITQKLNTIYQTVNTKTSTSGTFDVVIITGLRKGTTPRPSGSATPRASSSPSPSGSRSPSPTPTPTLSP